MNPKTHSGRKHSRFSASGFERISKCSGSVALSEGLPDKDNVWSLEGTKAHEVLEKILNLLQKNNTINAVDKAVFGRDVPREMFDYGLHAAKHILTLHYKAAGSDLMVESRVTLEFIHPEAFGSLDAAVVDHFGTLHILDYKYGMSLVSPRENLQFLFYALAVAYKYRWNFKKVRMWTLQPRVRGFDGYTFWEITIEELKKYVPVFKEAIERVEKYPNKYTEGEHCHWCRAKSICPLKVQGKLDAAIEIFKAKPIDKTEDLDEISFL